MYEYLLFGGLTQVLAHFGKTEVKLGVSCSSVTAGETGCCGGGTVLTREPSTTEPGSTRCLRFCQTFAFYAFKWNVSSCLCVFCFSFSLSKREMRRLSKYGSSNCKSPPPPSRHLLLKLQGLPDLAPAWFAFVKTWLIHSLLRQLLTFTINLLHVMSRSRPLNVPQQVPVNHSLLVGNSATFWRNSCWILLFRFWQMEEFK